MTNDNTKPLPHSYAALRLLAAEREMRLLKLVSDAIPVVTYAFETSHGNAEDLANMKLWLAAALAETEVQK